MACILQTHHAKNNNSNFTIFSQLFHATTVCYQSIFAIIVLLQNDMNIIMTTPNLQSMQKIAELVKFKANQDEALNYWGKAIDTKFAKSKQPPPQSLLSQIKQSQELASVNLQANQTAWSGNFAATNETLNLQHFMAEQAVNVIGNEEILAENIKHDIAINEECSYVRAFTTGDNVKVSERSEEALDRLFNDWLAANHYASLDSQIVELDNNGEIERDDNYHPIPADKEDVERRLTDPNHGFSSYMEKKGLNLDVYTWEYPREELQTDAEKEAGQAPTSM